MGALRRYLWEERFRRIWQQYFVKPPKIIRARDYPLPCTLEERVVVGGTGTFVLYRFRFPQSDQVRSRSGVTGYLSREVEVELGFRCPEIGSTWAGHSVRHPSYLPSLTHFVPLILACITPCVLSDHGVGPGSACGHH